MKYILCYKIKEYFELGGGQYVETFDSVEAMDHRVNELASDPNLGGDKFVVNHAVSVGHSYTYTPKTRITRYERG